MITEPIQKMIHEVTSSGLTPRTLLLTPDDAKLWGIPTWTKQLFGMKVVIAGNWPSSKVVPHFYDTVVPKKASDKEQAYREKWLSIR